MKNYRLVTSILTILVVLLVIIVVYLIKNPKIEYVELENISTNQDNKTTNNNYDDISVKEDKNNGVRIEFTLNCKAKAYKNETKDIDSDFCDGFYGRYYIGGDICIDNCYADTTSVSTRIKTDIPVIDIKVGTNYDGYWTALNNSKEGDTYDFTSTAYFLFKDGTIGKISTDDIKQGNYTVTKLEQYKNIISLVSCNLPEFSGGDVNLYAVDAKNDIYQIDIVASGD